MNTPTSPLKTVASGQTTTKSLAQQPTNFATAVANTVILSPAIPATVIEENHQNYTLGTNETYNSDIEEADKPKKRQTVNMDKF